MGYFCQQKTLQISPERFRDGFFSKRGVPKATSEILSPEGIRSGSAVKIA